MTAPDKLGGAINQIQAFSERFPNAVFEPIETGSRLPNTVDLDELKEYDRDVEEYKEYIEAAIDKIEGSLAVLKSGRPEDITSEVFEDLRRGLEVVYWFKKSLQQYQETQQNVEEPAIISELSAKAFKLLGEEAKN